MSFVIPAPADLVARFPAFASVPTSAVAGALAESAGRVDATWIEADAPIAAMLYAAHVLTLDGLGTGAEAAAAAAGALGFQSMRSGSLSLERRPPSGRDAGSLLQETTYGRRFLALLRVNQPAVAVP